MEDEEEEAVARRIMRVGQTDLTKRRVPDVKKQVVLSSSTSLREVMRAPAGLSISNGLSRRACEVIVEDENSAGGSCGGKRLLSSAAVKRVRRL